MQSKGDKKIKKIGVLRGGVGKHYTASLRKGGEIISYILENLNDKYKTADILIDKNHIWHFNGLPVNPADLLSKVDMVWNTSHPNLSNILDSLSIPNIGVSSFSYILENNKETLKEHLKKIGINMPRSLLLPVYQADFDGERDKYAIKKAKEVHEKFGAPWIVKSFIEDANIGIHLAQTFPELVNAIEDGVKHEKSILVEEFIAGKVASVHSVSGYRDQDIYTFPLGNTFGNFSTLEKEKIMTLTKDLYKQIGAKHYLKTDLVLNPQGRVFLLQIDSVPDLKMGSHFSEVCESIGTKMHNIVEHILEKALV